MLSLHTLVKQWNAFSWCLRFKQNDVKQPTNEKQTKRKPESRSTTLRVDTVVPVRQTRSRVKRHLGHKLHVLLTCSVVNPDQGCNPNENISQRVTPNAQTSDDDENEKALTHSGAHLCKKHTTSARRKFKARRRM